MPSKMFKAISSFKDFAKLSGWSPATENLVFQLHTKLTVLLLVTFSALVTVDVFFGKPIECVANHKNEFPAAYLDTYCWMHATYTISSAYDGLKVGEDVLAPGVANGPEAERIYHSYYQWVGLFLFFAGVAFYLPHVLWKELEGKRMVKTMMELNVLVAEDEDKREADVRRLAEHLQRCKGGNTSYAMAHAACEMLNLVVVISQIFITDVFLGGEFTTYGNEVVAFLRMEFTDRTDPMVKIFPRVAKCAVYKMGPSGSIQNHDAICVLPINVANEKIFIFLWFWYLALAVVSGLAVAYRALLMAFGRVRLLVLRCGCRYADRWAMEDLVLGAKASYSDWFVLRLLERNLSAKNFRQLIQELDKLDQQEELQRCGMVGYEDGDTMPAEFKTNLYGPTKVRISSCRLNGAGIDKVRW